MFATTCGECGGQIKARRLGAGYCADKCKQKAYRDRKRERSAYYDMLCAGCGHPRDWHNLESMTQIWKPEKIQPEWLDCSHRNCECAGYLEEA